MCQIEIFVRPVVFANLHSKSLSVKLNDCIQKFVIDDNTEHYLENDARPSSSHISLSIIKTAMFCTSLQHSQKSMKLLQTELK